MTASRTKAKNTRKMLKRNQSNGGDTLLGMTPSMKKFGTITLALATLTSAALYAWRRLREEAGGYQAHPAAFADAEVAPANFHQTKSAGSEGMRDTPDEKWDKIDQAADRSFPASDPSSF